MEAWRCRTDRACHELIPSAVYAGTRRDGELGLWCDQRSGEYRVLKQFTLLFLVAGQHLLKPRKCVRFQLRTLPSQSNCLSIEFSGKVDRKWRDGTQMKLRTADFAFSD